MNATWLTNKSGQWRIFGTNSSISNNTNIKQNNLAFNTNTYVCDDVDAQAWEGSDSDGSFNDDDGEFTSGDYANIDEDDPNAVGDSGGSDGEFQYHRFNFTINENVNDITQIDITWKGNGGSGAWPVGTHGASLWVKDNGSWSEKDSYYVEGEDPRQKKTLTAQKTSSFDEWINGSYLECAAQSDGAAIFASSDVSSYYVEVKISTELQYNTTYYWSVNLSDGSDWTNETYHFTTENPQIFFGMLNGVEDLIYDEVPANNSIVWVDEDGITTSVTVDYTNFVLPQRYEYYNTGDNGNINANNQSIPCQTFTVGNVSKNESFFVSSVNINLSLIVSDNIKYVICETDEDGKPTNATLASRTINKDTLEVGWNNLTFATDSPIQLEPGETYGFYLDVSPGNVNWRYHTVGGEYEGGSVWIKYEGEWNNVPPLTDCMFEIWGTNQSQSSIEIVFDWYNESFGDWQEYHSCVYVNNGTYFAFNSNFSGVDTYMWRVSAVANDTGVNHSEWYQFDTRYQSKITNTGSTNIRGYLLMQVQYNNSGEWVVDKTVVNNTLQTINSSEQLVLDQFFNGQVNTDNLSNGNGTYRVYVALRDPEGDVLICDDETALESWWEFEVDTS